ncbi:helix-turn-helix domain-containing protein [Pleomorphomonas sp. PLEO]|uniref:helix-turn-helix domain-containing protein n=1 Tax=Pleomorphomonas sp. PLEO TaxID=3239306 RepID=UPI00351F58EB
MKSDNDDILIKTRSRGGFDIQTKSGDYQLGQSVGFVFTPNHAFRYATAKSTAMSEIKIKRSIFDATVQKYTESNPSGWSGIVRFSTGDGFGHLMQALANRYRENFAGQAEYTYSETSLRLIQDAAIVAIAELLAAGLDRGTVEKVTVSKRNVMRAVDLINVQTVPLTIHDLATALGISVRALQDGFRKHLNASPHTLLKTGRIEGARRDLISGKATSIKDAAAKWGFSNIARFSNEYYAIVGECPKETMRIWRDGDD